MRSAKCPISCRKDVLCYANKTFSLRTKLRRSLRVTSDEREQTKNRQGTVDPEHRISTQIRRRRQRKTESSIPDSRRDQVSVGRQWYILQYSESCHIVCRGRRPQTVWRDDSGKLYYMVLLPHVHESLRFSVTRHRSRIECAISRENT